MVAKLRLELEEATVEEVDCRDDHEFYETIEAPKFVDFLVPNHFCPDDRYWFCSRVGCNRKHEEEMNPEAIYKDFVLRVMAARSPNVRFRRALDRKPLSDSKKCPLSAPPKPCKSRLPRLAIVSSISKKLYVDDEKCTNRPLLAKPVSTPKARVKRVPAKYMTSPRKRKGGSSHLNAFRSVRNPLKTSITLQKNKVVAKALLFSSPKKSAKVKAAGVKATPITRLCEGVKKLTITSEKKIKSRKPSKESASFRKVLPKKSAKVKASQVEATPITGLCEGVMKLTITSEKKIKSRKQSKESASIRKVLPTDTSRKQSKACKGNEQSAKASRCVKDKAKQLDKKHNGGGALYDTMSGDDSSDMEIDEKSRAGSIDVRSATVKSENEDKLSEHFRNSSPRLSGKEPTSPSKSPVTAVSSKGTLTSESNPIPESEDHGSHQLNAASNQKLQTADEDEENQCYIAEDGPENKDQRLQTADEDKENQCYIAEDGLENEDQRLQTADEDKENQCNAAEDDLENQNPGVAGGELVDNNDKENSLNSNIRNICVVDLSKNDKPVKYKVKTMQKLQTAEKNLKDSCPAGVMQGVKYKKLKPTHPKPFRLRTDERGILKEATLEKKVNAHESLSNTSENSQCIENATREKASKNTEGRTVKKLKFIPVKSKYMQTSKEAELKLDRCKAPCEDNQSRMTKPPTKQKLVQTQSEVGSRLKSKALTVTRETVRTLKGKESRPISNEITVPTRKASTVPSLATQRRKPTVPREPNFHTMHKPKSCTRNIV